MGIENVSRAAALRPSTVMVELRSGWPMSVGVILSGREIVWRAPVARLGRHEALIDAQVAMLAGLAKPAEQLRERAGR